MATGPSLGPTSAYPTFRTPALICRSELNDVFVPGLIAGMRVGRIATLLWASRGAAGLGKPIVAADATCRSRSQIGSARRGWTTRFGFGRADEKYNGCGRIQSVHGSDRQHVSGTGNRAGDIFRKHRNEYWSVMNKQ